METKQTAIDIVFYCSIVVVVQPNRTYIIERLEQKKGYSHDNNENILCRCCLHLGTFALWQNAPK